MTRLNPFDRGESGRGILLRDAFLGDVVLGEAAADFLLGDEGIAIGATGLLFLGEVEGFLGDEGALVFEGEGGMDTLGFFVGEVASFTEDARFRPGETAAGFSTATELFLKLYGIINLLKKCVVFTFSTCGVFAFWSCVLSLCTQPIIFDTPQAEAIVGEALGAGANGPIFFCFRMEKTMARITATTIKNIISRNILSVAIRLESLKVNLKSDSIHSYTHTRLLFYTS